MSFNDKVVIVTGAAGNLGSAVAQAFAAQGAKVAMVDIDRARLQQVHGDDSDTQFLVATDLRDSAKTAAARSEEHTSELQSLMRISYAVFCLKKKKTNTTNINTI